MFEFKIGKYYELNTKKYSKDTISNWWKSHNILEIKPRKLIEYDFRNGELTFEGIGKMEGSSFYSESLNFNTTWVEVKVESKFIQGEMEL